MELQLLDRDYVPDGFGGFKRVTGADEILHRALFKLTARRGAFLPMPEIGSRLYTLPRTSKAGRESAARQFVAEALDGENVSVEDVTVYETDGGIGVHVRLSAENTAMDAVIAF